MSNSKRMKVIKRSEMEINRKFKANAKDKETGFVQSFEFIHSSHSLERAAQRGINNLRIELTLVYGESFRKQGYEFCVLGENRIPDEYQKSKDKLINTVVVMDSDRIITCYVAKDPYRQIKKKSKTLWTYRHAA